MGQAPYTQCTYSCGKGFFSIVTLFFLPAIALDLVLFIIHFFLFVYILCLLVFFLMINYFINLN